MTAEQEAQIIKDRQANCTRHPAAFVRDPYHSRPQCAFCGLPESDYVPPPDPAAYLKALAAYGLRPP